MEEEAKEQSNNIEQVIKPIDSLSVHKLCAGQVITSLASAVKELIENSLDAGATNIDVRLKEHGVECIEVCDNGTGVTESNFEALTLKHCTSKISTFDDLSALETFGFRGEALSSICALGKTMIITRDHSCQAATRLELDFEGKIVNRYNVPRPVGTSVSVRNLFSTLPVRQKDFQRNKSREFSKMVHLLHAYCLISKGVKFTCTNQTGLGATKSTVVSCPGSNNLMENIASLFSSKQLNTLLAMQPVLELPEDIITAFGLTNESIDYDLFKLDGFVSTCQQGQGRSSADKQFFYVNGRPCELPKVAKLVNEIYHTFNKNQYPLVVLNIFLNKDNLDVNVSPDKRTIFVQNEKLLLALVKASLLITFNRQCMGLLQSPCVSRVDTGTSSPLPETSGLIPIIDVKAPPKTPGRLLGTQELKRAFKHVSFSPVNTVIEVEPVLKQPKLDAFVTSSLNTVSDTDVEAPLQSSQIEQYILAEPSSDGSLQEQSFTILVDKDGALSVDDLTAAGVQLIFHTVDQVSSVEPNSQVQALSEGELVTEAPDVIIQNESDGAIVLSNNGLPEESCPTSTDVELVDATELGEAVDASFSAPTTNMQVEDYSKFRKVVRCDFTMDRLKGNSVNCQNGNGYERVNKFRVQLQPDKASEAEEELGKEFSKESFQKLEILGQFNLGFIIVKLHRDLFIVDQHATDEKYNYETLQKTATLHNQRLMAPQNLDLSPENEDVIIENMAIFERNGFQFQVEDVGSEAGKRVRLVAVPSYTDWTFDKTDVDEMVFMLADTPGIMCRPTKTHRMFASKACRKSIMIGTALNQQQMSRLISHMGELEHPWNCPHGRPTIRHLVNLDILD